MELRFQGGHSIPVHSLKLKLASSVLKDMITSTLDDQIASAAAKRRKTADGGNASGQDMPYVQVSVMQRHSIYLLVSTYYMDTVLCRLLCCAIIPISNHACMRLG